MNDYIQEYFTENWETKKEYDHGAGADEWFVKEDPSRDGGLLAFKRYCGNVWLFALESKDNFRNGLTLVQLFPDYQVMPFLQSLAVENTGETK